MTLSSRHALGSIDLPGTDGRLDRPGGRVSIELLVEHDGIEFVGRLAFTEDGGDRTVTDRGLLPGRTVAEVLERARRLRSAELTRRFQRATVEQRQYLRMRRATDAILGQIRSMSRLARSVNAGMLDRRSAAAEVEQIEARLHELVRRLRHAAGVEAKKPKA